MELKLKVFETFIKHLREIVISRESARNYKMLFLTTINIYFVIKGDQIKMRGHIWNKVFKNGPSKICGTKPLKMDQAKFVEDSL